MTTEVILFVLLIVQSLCLVAVTVALLRRADGGPPMDDLLHWMVEMMQHDQTQLAVLTERMEGLKPLAQSVGHIRDGLTEMQSRIRAREDMERRTAEAIHRLEAVIAGTHTKGAAAEHLVDAVFSRLPPEWQVRNLRIGNKVVEFGLQLPNGLVLPIDSKWAATTLLEEFSTTDDPERRREIKAQLEATVLERSREVRKYIDPNLTMGFALAVVPDAVYELCSGVQAEAFSTSVVLVGHSLFVPYLLLVFQTVLKSSQQVDVQRLDLYLTRCQQGVSELQEELEGRFSRAMAMLANSRQMMAGGLSQVQAELGSLRRGSEAVVAEEQDENIEASELLDDDSRDL